MLSNLFKRQKEPPYLAMAEFWVYLEGKKVPSQDDLMTRMIQENPYARSGASPLGPKEGLMWSDVRFHMAVAKREKNAHIFRPDLFEGHVEPTAELLEALGASQVMVKLRYVSHQRLPDTRHLQFLIHATESVAALGGSRVIFDLVGERLMCPHWLAKKLEENNDGARRELHLRVIWRPGPHGGVAETRGLSKIGLPEVSTPETMEDHRVVAVQVLEDFADRVWETGEIPEQSTVDLYGDRFHVMVTRKKKGPWEAKILREAGCGQSE